MEIFFFFEREQEAVRHHQSSSGCVTSQCIPLSFEIAAGVRTRCLASSVSELNSLEMVHKLKLGWKLILLPDHEFLWEPMLGVCRLHVSLIRPDGERT